MICGPQKEIQLGTLLYGTKLQAQQQCTFGVADCVKTKLLCCNFDERDKLTQFSEQDRQNVSDNCEGKETCKAFAPRLGTNPFSSYVIMNYTCVQGNILVFFSALRLLTTVLYTRVCSYIPTGK